MAPPVCDGVVCKTTATSSFEEVAACERRVTTNSLDVGLGGETLPTITLILVYDWPRVNSTLVIQPSRGCAGIVLSSEGKNCANN